MTDEIAPYPLHWPAGVARTRYRTQPKFGEIEVTRAIRELQDEVARVRGTLASSIVVSSNLAYGRISNPSDPGVAVYFKRRINLKGGPVDHPYQLACDRWMKVQHNMRALTKHVESLRGQERWGVGTIEQAFAGYAALPPPVSHTVVSRPWFEVLGVYPTMPIEAVEAVYRTLAKKAHPDGGGTLTAMAELNAAIADARAALT